MVVYLDTSALVKLVVREGESAALRRFLVRHPIRVSSALVRVELPRAVRAQGDAALARARSLLASLHLLRLDDALLDVGGALDAAILRSLDAIHLATAKTLGAELEEFVTYDRRMVEAAEIAGLPVAAPS